MNEQTQQNQKTQGQILSEIENLVSQLSKQFTASKMIVEAPEGGDTAFQVVATERLTEAGKVDSKLEVLREGEVIEQDGRRFRVVKNEVGTLYKSSISPMGQVGLSKPVSISEFMAQQLRQIDEAFPAGDAGAHFLSVFRDASSRPALDTFGDMQITAIQGLFEKMFSLEAQALSKVINKKVHGTEMIDGRETLVMPMYASIRIKNQFTRAKQIRDLIQAINSEASIGAIRGFFAPLSSIIVPVQQKIEKGTFIEKLAAPIERFDEIVFIFPQVIHEFHARIKGTYDFFRNEGDLPAE